MSLRDDNDTLDDWLHSTGAFDSPRFALAYHLHSLGFSILPLSASTKRPTVKWKRLQTGRASVMDLVDWFVRHDWRPGIITGAISGIVIVDCDSATVPESATDLCQSQTTQTTNRGTHFVNRHPGYRCGNRQRVNGDPVDVRGDGGYVVAYDDSATWTVEQIASAPIYHDVYADPNSDPNPNCPDDVTEVDDFTDKNLVSAGDLEDGESYQEHTDRGFVVSLGGPPENNSPPWQPRN